MSDDWALEVSRLSKTYRSGWLGSGRAIQALQDVSLGVRRGEIFGLLGPNGAGKTTLVKILLGIIRCNDGAGHLLGHSLGTRASRRQIGYLPENLRLAPHHNARSALAYYGGLSGMSGRRIAARRDDLLNLVGLADRARDSVRKYSKGMVQRLGLAQCMLHDPELLFLDEPTDGLDPVGRSQIRQVLLQLKTRGKTVFLNSHILQEVEQICDRVAILDRGRLLKIGRVDQLDSASGEELQLHVLGEPAVIAAALEGLEYTLAGEHGPSTLAIRPSDQREVDRCIDRLRAKDVSIMAMHRRRLTLEEIFLDVVQQVSQEPAS